MDTLVALLAGSPTAEMRIWSALAPAVLATAWFLFGLLVFAVRCALAGVPEDAETLKRGGSKLVGPFLRHYFFWLINPLWRLVLRSGLPPTALTTLSVLLGLGAGVAAAAGRFALAGWLFIFSGIFDTLDGRVARTRKQATPWGAAIDSTLDRYTDSAILIGLAWYYRSSWVLLPVLLALLGSSLVPYVRARGEGLGVSVKDGLMQRVERVILLGGGTALSPVLEAVVTPSAPHPMHWLAVFSVIVLAVTSNWTAVMRLRSVVQLLRGDVAPRHARRPALSERLGLNVAAGAVATGVDFAFVFLLVERLQVGPALATAAGCAVGAAVNFGLNRVVTFRSTARPLPQLGRYAVVSAASLLLNAGGVAVCASLPAVGYQVSWLLVRVAVFLLWNFPLHDTYVFDDTAVLEKEQAA